MARPILITPGQVSEYINKNAWRYLEALKITKDVITAFRFSERGRNAIYMIYSRGQMQRGGDELKEAWQVKEKVNKMRTEGVKDLNIPPNPNFAIQDIGDIVALTAVCVYPSDIAVVSGFLDNHRDVKVIYKYSKEDRGYQALHFVLGLRNPKYAEIRCEVQVKTILHDAWSAKTHDLTYKPQGSLPKDIHDHMTDISQHLTTLDGQSERFKNQIQRAWRQEKKRRNASRQALLEAIMGGGPKNKKRKTLYERIARDLRVNAARYRRGNVLKRLSEIDQFAGSSPDLYSSQLITYLAALREEDDLDSVALDHIDRWTCCLKDEDLVWGLIFQGLAFFFFNRIREAVESGEKALEIAERLKIPSLRTQTLVNLAHYLAELGGQPDSNNARVARHLMKRAVRVAGGFNRLKMSQQDTYGYVKIVFGKDKSEIEDGQNICRRAAGANDVARVFGELHDEIARERLRQWEIDQF